MPLKDEIKSIIQRSVLHKNLIATARKYVTGVKKLNTISNGVIKSMTVTMGVAITLDIADIKEISSKNRYIGTHMNMFTKNVIQNAEKR